MLKSLYKVLTTSCSVFLLKRKSFLLIKGPLGVTSISSSTLLNVVVLTPQKICVLASSKHKAHFFTFLTLFLKKTRGVEFGFLSTLAIKGVG